MHPFIVASTLLIVTSYLIEIKTVSCYPIDLVHFFALLSVVSHLYRFITDFFGLVITLHGCYEHVNMDAPHLKWYSEKYHLALLQIGLQQLHQMFSEVISGIWQSMKLHWPAGKVE